MCPRGLRWSGNGKGKRERLQIQSDFLTHRNDAFSPPTPSTILVPRQEVEPAPAYARLMARVDNSEHLQLPLGKL